MLRITISSDKGSVACKLEGRLSGPWVAELEQAWRGALIDSAEIIVDLRSVSFVSEEGKELLARMRARGAKLVASAPWTKSLIERISSRVLVALAVLAAFGAWNVQAQEPGTLKITLRDAVQRALRENPQAQIANLNLAESEQNARISRSALLPQASLSTAEQVHRLNLGAFIGQSFPGFPNHIGPFETFQAGPNFSMPIFDLSLWRRWQASKAGVDASASEEHTVREEIAVLVVSQYLGGLRAAADVKAARSRVDLAQALYNQAADLQKSGAGTGIDTLRAQVELENEQQRLITSETQLKTTLFGLARLLNLKPDQNVELADEVQFFDTPGIAVDQGIQTALAKRPEMQALEARRRSLERDKQAAGAERLPVVSFAGNWSYQGLNPGSSIPTYLYSGSVDIPLFTGGRIQAERARAEIEIRKLDQQKQDQANAIALEVKTAAAQLESANHEVTVANRGADLAREEVSQARDRFAAGVANNIEVISAQDALSRASDNQIAALYRYNQARADLARATGQAENVYGK